MFGGKIFRVELRNFWWWSASRNESGIDEGIVIDDAMVDGLMDLVVDDRWRTYFPLVPLVAFGHLLSDIEVMSIFGLLLVFDASGFFVDTVPVGISVFLDELSVETLRLTKAVQSRQRAVTLGEGDDGYRICSEPGDIVGDSHEGYEDARDPDHGQPERRGEP